jgi:hypothetical protein
MYIKTTVAARNPHKKVRVGKMIDIFKISVFLGL